MVRFGLKDLLLSTTLVAAGLAAIVLVFKNLPPDALWPELDTLFISGYAMLGAGALTPFKKPWIGASVGIVTGVAVQFIVAINAIMRM